MARLRRQRTIRAATVRLSHGSVSADNSQPGSAAGPHQTARLHGTCALTVPKDGGRKSGTAPAWGLLGTCLHTP